MDSSERNNGSKLRHPLGHMTLAVGFSVPVALGIHEAIGHVQGHGPEQLAEGRWITLLVTLLVAGPVSFCVALLRRRLENRVSRLHQKLSRANAEKAELMEVVSHDLKSPLSAVLNATELLAEHLREPDSLQLCRMIDAKARQMYELVAGVLELGRLDAGLLAHEEQPVSLCQAAGEAKAAFAYRTELKGLRIQCREPNREVWVSTNPQVLRLVLDNLLGNAIQFSPISGQITLEVKVGEPGEALFICHDQGPGLEPELAGRIFGKFEQGGETEASRHLAGGLGLYIAKRLTEGLGGRIWVESVPGMGASFFLALPSLAGGRSA